MSNSIDGSRPESRDTRGSGLGTVVGYPSAIQRLRTIVIHPVGSAWAGTPGVVAPSGVLLYGPPGNGAATLRAATADELGVDCVALDPRDSSSPAAGPCVVLLDGVDGFSGDERSPLGRGAQGLAEHFDRMGRVPADQRPLTVATSAAPWHLDQRLFATGRFDRLVFVPPPDWAARSVLLETESVGRGLAVTERISQLAAATVGWCGTDLADLLDEFESEAGAAGSSSAIGSSSHVLDVVSRIVPRTRSWSARAREMADRWTVDGMIDDLEAWLRRTE